jgi:hypothetical protein
MMDEIPWAVGQHAEKTYEGTMLGRFDKMAAELRDDEVLKVASGEAVPSLQEDWPKELPPARTRESKAATDKNASLLSDA